MSAKQTSLGTAVFEVDQMLPSHLFHVFVLDGEDMEVANYSRSFFNKELAQAYFNSLV